MKTFIKELIKGKDTSSKRFSALYIILIPVTSVVGTMLYKDKNHQMLLVTLLGFAGALWGLSEFNKAIKIRKEDKISIKE